MLMSYPFCPQLNVISSQSAQGDRPGSEFIKNGPQSTLPGVKATHFQPAPVDRASIFTEVLGRNAARRQAQLPLLDIRKEFECAVAMAEERAYRDFAAAHATDRHRLTNEVLAEYVAKHGRPPGSGLMQQWVSAEGYKRLWAYLEQEYGVVRPSFQSRGAVKYGSARPAIAADGSQSPSNDAHVSADASPEGSAP